MTRTRRHRVLTVPKLIDRLVKKERELNALPELSGLEKAQLEHSRALQHLYNSSKIEGTHLTKERIDKAVYGSEIAPASK
ncbi:MAG: hypothetical protein ACYDH9_14115 [Limisphaerales bacterium]